MAKNNKQAAVAAPVEKNVSVSEETIAEQIKNENKMDQKALDSALDLIQQEKDERKAKELKHCICKADYVNKRELLELRKRRAEEKATKESLTASKDALDKLTSGEITPNEYDKLLKESDRNKREAFGKIEVEHTELVNELRTNYPTYYTYDWEYERRSRNW